MGSKFARSKKYYVSYVGSMKPDNYTSFKDNHDFIIIYAFDFIHTFDSALLY